MSLQPYKYWSRDQLIEHLLPQCADFNIDAFLMTKICFDKRWNPAEDFDGCTLVQDKYHPFLPCFIHDYRWIIGDAGLSSDIEFRVNLQKAGFSKWKAYKYFYAVRLGWLLYYKWK